MTQRVETSSGEEHYECKGDLQTNLEVMRRQGNNRKAESGTKPDTWSAGCDQPEPRKTLLCDTLVEETERREPNFAVRAPRETIPTQCLTRCR